jgi:hypothetical protein
METTTERLVEGHEGTESPSRPVGRGEAHRLRSVTRTVVSLTPWRVFLVMALVATVALLAAWQSRVPVTVDVGSQSGNIDNFYITSFHGPEQSERATFRWAYLQGDVHFTGVGYADWRVTVSIASNRPPGTPLPGVTLLGANGTQPFASIPEVSGDFSTYSPDVRVPTTLHGDIHLGIAAASVYTATNDPREKGVAVDLVRLTPNGPVIPPIGSLAAMAITVGALSAAVAMAAGVVAGLLVGGLLLFGLALLAAAQRLWLTPYIGLMLLFSLALLGGVLVSRALFRRYVLAPAGPDALDRAVEARRTDGTALALVALLTGVFAFALVQFCFDLGTMFGRARATDFQAMWQATKSAMIDLPLYNLEGLRDNPFGSYYKYPPTFSGLLRPITLFDFDTARDVWRGLNLAFLAAGIGVILIALTRRPLVPVPSDDAGADSPRSLTVEAWAAPAALGLMFLTLIYRPAIDALNYGQLDPVILLLLALTFALLRMGRGTWAGVPLGIAVGLKIYPVVMVLYLLWRREWRALGVLAATLVGWVLLGLVLTDPASTVTYFGTVLPSSGGTTAWIENQTLSGFVARLLTDRISIEPFAADTPGLLLAVNVLNYGVAAALLGLTLWMARGPQVRGGTVYALGFAGVLTASIFLLPAAWLHYMTALLLPFGIVLYTLQGEGALWWRGRPRLLLTALVLLGLAMGLLAFANIWFFFDGENQGGIWKLILSYKFFGAVALWLSIITLLRIARQSPQASPPLPQPAA